MKTIEEKDRVIAAVFAECDRLCPAHAAYNYDLGNSLVLHKNPFGHYNSTEWSIRHKGFDQKIVTISSNTNGVGDFGNACFNIFYNLLGLQARDAVEAEREKFEVDFQMLKNQILQSDDSIKLRDELLKASETRAAALVEALDEINHHHGYFYANGNGEYQGMGGEKILTPVGKRILAALEAYKKGGAGE